MGEDGENAVADEFQHLAVMGLDRFDQAGGVFVEEAQQMLALDLVGDAGEMLRGRCTR